MAKHCRRASLLAFLLAVLAAEASGLAAPAPPPAAADDDRSLAAAPDLAFPGEQLLERDGLRFHFTAADRLAALELSRTGGRARAAIAADLGADDGRPFEVYLAHDREAFSRLLGGAPDWMAGVAFAGARCTVLRLDPRGDAPWQQVEETFRHELSHLMLRQATGGRAAIPRWFAEGFAIYQAREWSFERAQTLTRAILRGRVFRLAEISSTFPAEPDRVQIAYAQSVAFTGYLLRQGHGGAFGRLLAGLASGQPFPQAIRQAFGRPLEELEQEWQDQLERDYAWVPLLLGGSSLWLLVTLLFLLAYLVHRAQRRHQLARLAAQDAGVEPGAGVGANAGAGADSPAAGPDYQN